MGKRFASVQPVLSLHDAAMALVDHAIESLQGGTDEQAVHAARKACKRVRAALRMLRDGFGEREYRSDNRRIRDSARPLTAVRDAVILRRTLAKLSKHPQPLARDLEADYHRAWRALEDRGAQTAVVRLRAARERLARVSRIDSETASAITGATGVYKAGRKALHNARSRDDQALHEWRKQAKYLVNQLELLSTVFNARFRKLHRRADRLAEALGDDHDLSVLAGKLASGEAGDRTLRKRIKKRRRKLQARAFRLGRRLYRHSTKRIEATLVAHLSNAQRMSSSTHRGIPDGY
ncbi:MAG TPA: CHAD domain-containing protein [Steroidobacteraceae bacterium]|jgi:CHAD domain-containing protein|nr:CHAD domain-containing protein [Steroidobacteraceae bacterium]